MEPLIITPNSQDLIKDSTTKTFAVDVIEASKSVPVLVDFWAPWCGPCKTLGPTLEKLVREAKGKIKLVKVDIDQNPEIAGQLRVQSIPAVFAFVDGRAIDGFMGALPESQLRQFIARLDKKGGRAEQLDQALQMARDTFAAGNFEATLDVCNQIIEVEASIAEPYALKAKAEMGLRLLPEAQATLASCPPEVVNHAAIISAKATLELLLNPVDTTGLGKLHAAIAANANDLESRLELASLLNGLGEREAATDQLVFIIKKDRGFKEDGARKQLISYFEAWGPKDDATLSGRRKLASVLFA